MAIDGSEDYDHNFRKGTATDRQSVTFKLVLSRRGNRQKSEIYRLMRKNELKED